MKIKKQLLIALCTLLVAYPAVSQSQKTYQWRIVSNSSQDSELFSRINNLLVDYAAKLSAGRLVLVTDNQSTENSDWIWNGVTSGKFQMGRLATPYLGSKDVNMTLFSSMPFGMISPEMTAWFYEGGGIELMQEAYAKHGLLSFPGGNLGNQMGGLFRKPVKTLSDLKDLKLSLSGMSAQAMQSLGAELFNMTELEKKAALRSGALDAIEWGGPSLHEASDLYETAPYYYTGWDKPSIEQQMLVNKDAYNALPEDLQYALKTAIKLASYDTYTLITHANALQLRELQAKHPKLKIRAFPRDVMLALKQAVAEQYVQLENQDGLSRRIIDSMMSYQEQIRLWIRIGDQAYLNNSGF